MIKKFKQLKTKKQKVLVSLLVAFLCVVLFSTVAFAWFSLTNAPSVHNLTLRAGTAGNLMISNERDKGYSDSITLELSKDCCLRPITTVNGTTFYKPVYGANGVVSHVSSVPVSEKEMEGMINASEADGGWVIKKTFYLKTTVTDLDTIDIRLMAPIANREIGTEINNASEDTNGAEAIRISFTYNGVTGIVEPNADLATPEQDSNQAYMPGYKEMNINKQGANYNFSNDGGKSYTEGESDILFRIPTNTPAEVTMYIWLEGADKDCVNAIMGSEIDVQLRFISKDIE